MAFRVTGVLGRVLLLALVAMLWGCMNGAGAGGRRELLLDDGWKFHKGDMPEAHAMGFDDHAWRDVRIPHDWGIEGPFSQEWASGQGYLPGGVGWYRRVIELPPDAADKQISLRFDGAYKRSRIWCNGQLVGGRPFGYISFAVDLTPFVKAGQKNEIAVRVDHTDFADSRWYTGSGIYRNVYLEITEKVHLERWGTFVTTPRMDTRSATVDIATTVRNEGPAAQVTLESILLDATGRVIGRVADARAIGAGNTGDFSQQVEVVEPRLWSVASPTLYTLRSVLRVSNRIVDSQDTPFGIRTFSFDAARGFSLNGQSMKLLGVCLHEDAGALGAAIPVQVWRRRLAILKEAGCNAIRTSHNPPAPELLDLCDQMGFLVMDEAFDEWAGPKNKWVTGWNQGTPAKFGYAEDFADWALRDIRDMVLRDRNHPSIIMWSIGNEVDYLNDPYPANSPELAAIAATLIKAVKEVDTTRPVTAACAAVGTNLFVDLLDIAGYNYQESRYAADHAAHPQRVIYGSENGHTLNAWNAVVQNDFIAGQFLWTGIDFLGEARRWPSRGSTVGILDLAGFRKPRFYQRKAWWTTEPMVHIEANAQGVSVYSNCQSVALYHDGTLIGEEAVPANRTVSGNFSFTTGTLRAVGKRDGVEVCVMELQAPGPAHKLVMVPDVTQLVGDGRDIAQIEVYVADEAGRRVPSAVTRIACTVEGPGSVIGIENGDQNSHENYQALSRLTRDGRMLVYLRSAKGHGELTVSVSAEGLQGAGTLLEVRRP